MSHKTKTFKIVGVILILVGLAACGSPTPTSAPTADLNPLRTQVASTVLAQVTRDLALTPSITPIPSHTPTSIPLPTQTQAPTVTPDLTLATTPGITTTVAASATPTGTVNLAQWVSQTIADDTVFTPGEAFTLIWRLRNVGTSTWTPAYVLRFFSGNAFGAPTEIASAKRCCQGKRSISPWK